MPSADTDCLPLHTPIDGEFVEQAVHLENRDHNRDLMKEKKEFVEQALGVRHGEFVEQALLSENRDHNIDDNRNVINNLTWITSINKPNHGELNKDDDINTKKNKTHGESNKDDHKDKEEKKDGPPSSSSNHVFECSTTNIAAINSDETNKNEEWDMVPKEVTEQVRATLINGERKFNETLIDGERTFNIIRGTLIDGGADVPTIGQAFNND